MTVAVFCAKALITSASTLSMVDSPVSPRSWSTSANGGSVDVTAGVATVDMTMLEFNALVDVAKLVDCVALVDAGSKLLKPALPGIVAKVASASVSVIGTVVLTVMYRNEVSWLEARSKEDQDALEMFVGTGDAGTAEGVPMGNTDGSDVFRGLVPRDDVTSGGSCTPGAVRVLADNEGREAMAAVSLSSADSGSALDPLVSTEGTRPTAVVSRSSVGTVGAMIFVGDDRVEASTDVAMDDAGNVDVLRELESTEGVTPAAVGKACVAAIGTLKAGKGGARRLVAVSMPILTVGIRLRMLARTSLLD